MCTDVLSPVLLVLSRTLQQLAPMIAEAPRELVVVIGNAGVVLNPLCPVLDFLRLRLVLVYPRFQNIVRSMQQGTCHAITVLRLGHGVFRGVVVA